MANRQEHACGSLEGGERGDGEMRKQEQSKRPPPFPITNLHDSKTSAFAFGPSIAAPHGLAKLRKFVVVADSVATAPPTTMELVSNGARGAAQWDSQEKKEAPNLCDASRPYKRAKNAAAAEDGGNLFEEASTNGTVATGAACAAGGSLVALQTSSFEEEEWEEMSDALGDSEAERIVLSEAQQRIVDSVLQRSGIGGGDFVTGGGGMGKSAAVNALCAALRKHDKTIMVVAPTGVAAGNVAGGQTCHAAFRFPIDPISAAAMADRAGYRRELRELLEKLDVLIIDEISMVSPKLFAAMDMVLQNTRKSQLSFGGVCVVLVGDFYQLPPIITADDAEHHDKCSFAFQHTSWKMLAPTPHVLDVPFRQAAGSRFVAVLNRVRTATQTDEDLAYLNARVGAKISLPEGMTCVKLECIRRDVQRENEQRLMQLPTPLFTSRHAMTIPNSEDAETRAQLQTGADGILKKVQALPLLNLKVGAQVCYLLNERDSTVLFNGAIGIVRAISTLGFHRVVAGGSASDGRELATASNPCVSVEFVDTATKEGVIVKVFPMTFEHLVRTVSHVPIDPKEPRKTRTVIAEHKVLYHQYPLLLAWSFTVHKTQGLSLSYAQFNTAAQFAEGQVYVALSRVRTYEGLTLTTPLQHKHIRVSPLVKAFYSSFAA